MKKTTIAILVIEDLPERHIQLKREMRGKNVKIIPAFNGKDALEKIRQIGQKNLFVDAVVVNACLGTHDLNVALNLVEKLEGVFFGPIIGTSEEEKFQEALKRAGCTNVCDHDSLPKMLSHALGL